MELVRRYDLPGCTVEVFDLGDKYRVTNAGTTPPVGPVSFHDVPKSWVDMRDDGLTMTLDHATPFERGWL